MKDKFTIMPSQEQGIANEPAMAYKRRESDSGLTLTISQKELETECFSLEESKNKLIETIHRHFHSQS